MIFFKSLVFFLYRIFSFGKHRNNGRGGVGLPRSASQLHSPTTYLNQNSKFQRLSSLPHHKPDLSNHTLLFDLEGSLLISPSPFPYFMLVAFEAGSIVRALVLLLLYPLVVLVSQEMGLKIMVMVCFFGIRKVSFRAGSAVLPKYFLEDVGFEGFDVMRKFEKKVGVSSFPRVMVETFLRDYLAVDVVIGRELKVVGGYFVGVMEEMGKIDFKVEEIKVVGEDTCSRGNNVVGVSSFKKSFVHHQLFSQCKEIYIVSKADKRSWHQLPMNKYPKPLIFHDGRLALRPDPLSVVALLMWAPFGVALCVFRVAIGLSLPYNLSIPINVFTGARITLSKPTSSNPRPKQSDAKKGLLYVCNHRTLLDPLYLAFMNKKELTALTYSLSRVSEILSPIKTVRLTRDRVKDAKMMENLLNQGDLVICPEGTTCREPYLLRFSPLFAEMSDEIVPVAVDSKVDWFHGNTAGGLKCLDPLFFFMNPRPSYNISFLEKVSGSSTCLGVSKTRFDVANHVQDQIGEVLGFQCTGLTRKDKYLVLAGNEGIVNNKT